MKKVQLFTFIVFLLLFLSCSDQDCNNVSDDNIRDIDYDKVPAYSENNFVNAVIEIPAGTNHKIEYDKQTGEFKVDQKDGRDRIIDFLPYPGSYGFIPSTYMDPAEGGDGDALDVLIISESIPTGTVLEIVPIAVVLFLDEEEIDNKIIAVPADSTKRIISAINFSGFEGNYGKAMGIIQDWFINYKGENVMQSIGWKDDEYAINEINKWKI